PRLLAAAAENERVAALQPDDPLAFTRRANHQRMNTRLTDGVPVGAFTDKEPLRPFREGEHARIDERVVEDEVRRAQPRHRFARQQLRVARSGADDRDMSGHTVSEVAFSYSAFNA